MDINPAVAQRASRAFRHVVGLVEDFPTELQNSLANVFYKFYASAADGPGYTAREFMLNVKEAVKSTADFEGIMTWIKAVRYAKEKDVRLFQILVRMAIDDFTYGIRNVTKKSGIRRAVERLFKRNSDIPGLYAYLVNLSAVPEAN